MTEKPLPQGSGIGRAAKREPGCRCCQRRAPAFIAAGALNRLFSSSGGISKPGQPGRRRSQVLTTSNGMPTLTTKPIPWANLPHPLGLGISVKMCGAEHVLAAVRCALARKEGWAP